MSPTPNPCGHCGLQPTLNKSVSGDEVSLLMENIDSYEAAILHLREKISAACSRLNAIKAPTRNLPDEILSTIFELAADLDDEPWFDTENPTVTDYVYTRPEQQYFPLYVLGAVCSHWRRVAWSTQSLWSCFDLVVVDDKPLVKHNFALPHLYFQNAGDRLRTISVDCRAVQQGNWVTIDQDEPGTQGYEEPLEPLRDLIFIENAPKITHLILNCPPPEWLPFLSEAFASLVWIELYWPPAENIAPYEPISLAKLPRLEKVSLKQVIVDVELAWEHITSLKLRNVGFKIASHLLVSCMNLVEYDAHDLLVEGLPSDPVPWLPVNQVTLHCLEVFNWEWYSDIRYAQLLTVLNFPSLQRLCWLEGEAEFDEYQTAISSFFAKLPAAQIHLHLSGFNGFMQDEAATRLSTILNSTPQLQRLSLSESSASSKGTLNVVVNLMKEARQRSLPILSNLQCFDAGAVYGGLGGSVESSLFQLIKEMQASGATQFRLEIPDPLTPLKWDPKTQASLKRMVREGFKLEILEDGKIVLWVSQGSET